MVKKCKTIRQNDSVMINIPDEFDIEAGKEYSLIKKDNGSIILIPGLENYFDNARSGEFHEPLEWEDIDVEGRELDV